MAQEIETKFKLYSVAKLKNKLKEIGAKFISKHLERDIYYNNAKSERCLESIRLRTIGKGGIFTIKEYLNSKESNIYKIRKEFEVSINDTEVFNDMLSKLGFKFSFRKEKVRETYVCKRAKICIDKLPYLGYYIEIESSKRKIKRTAALLGFDVKDAICDTYMDIFDSYKKINRKPELKLVFGGRKALGRATTV